MASIPVPPQLLLPISKTPNVSQSNTSGLGLKFSSSGSDPEPWRCKRTDGKKWRCSRDVAPDQKYCERHAHKNRPRSRKHVEIQPHNNNTTPQHLQRPTSQFPTMASTTSYDQTRCMEWFMRGGSSVTATCNQQQWQHQLRHTSSSSSRLNRDSSDHNKNVSLYDDIPYIPDTTGLEKLETLSTLDSKIVSLQNAADRTQTTRRFIDAWEKETNLCTSEKFSVSVPSSSLTLSMNGNDHNNDENGYLGIGMINPVPWMNSSSSSSTPGGPLGEALCLGNATTTRGNSNLASPAHGYSSKQ